MESTHSELVKISARMPKKLLSRLTRLHRRQSLSEVLRELVEREVLREKVLKAHMKLYGRFKQEHFDERVA